MGERFTQKQQDILREAIMEIGLEVASLTKEKLKVSMRFWHDTGVEMGQQELSFHKPLNQDRYGLLHCGILYNFVSLLMCAQQLV